MKGGSVKPVEVSSGVTRDERPAPLAEEIYAAWSATKIDEAARLIIKAAKLLDGCGGKHVIALVEAVEGSEYITTELGENLLVLAERLDQ